MVEADAEPDSYERLRPEHQAEPLQVIQEQMLQDSNLNCEEWIRAERLSGLIQEDRIDSSTRRRSRRNTSVSGCDWNLNTAPVPKHTVDAMSNHRDAAWTQSDYNRRGGLIRGSRMSSSRRRSRQKTRDSGSVRNLPQKSGVPLGH